MPLVLFDRAYSPHSALRITAVKTAADVAKPACLVLTYRTGGNLPFDMSLRGLEISVREGGLRITSGDFSR